MTLEILRSLELNAEIEVKAEFVGIGLLLENKLIAMETDFIDFPEIAYHSVDHKFNILISFGTVFLIIVLQEKVIAMSRVRLMCELLRASLDIEEIEAAVDILAHFAAVDILLVGKDSQKDELRIVLKVLGHLAEEIFGEVFLLVDFLSLVLFGV